VGHPFGAKPFFACDANSITALNELWGIKMVVGLQKILKYVA
jgi:hypothetical protein